MSHAIYQTPAIILATKNMRESNKLIWAYTQKFGLIYISAQSIRELKSKMRFHNNNLSLVDLDVVEGRDIWKLTGLHERISSMSFVGSYWHELMTDVSLMIQRLCRGEDSQPLLWDDLKNLYELSVTEPEISPEKKSILEILLTMRILFHLGYWEGDEVVTQNHDYLKTASYQYIDTHRKRLISEINQALNDSQL